MFITEGEKVSVVAWVLPNVSKLAAYHFHNWTEERYQTTLSKTAYIDVGILPSYFPKPMTMLPFFVIYSVTYTFPSDPQHPTLKLLVQEF